MIINGISANNSSHDGIGFPLKLTYFDKIVDIRSIIKKHITTFFIRYIYYIGVDMFLSQNMLTSQNLRFIQQQL